MRTTKHLAQASCTELTLWTLWAAQGSKEKNSIMNYGQLLNSVFSCFHGPINKK